MKKIHIHNRVKKWIYKRYLYDSSAKASNIFDYYYNARYRVGYYNEKYDPNIMYGMGTVFRDYAKYNKQIYCTTEHGIPPLRVDNFSEFRDNSAPILLVHSEERKELIQPLTNKIILSYGPSFIPYAKGIYTNFQIEHIKKNNGKTLVVFPIHNNDVSTYVYYKEEQSAFVEYIKEIQEQHSYEEVVVCLYYIEIERGMQNLYEREGWKVVCAGNNKNCDFADVLKTIFQIADAAVVQGFTGVAYATYLGIPCQFYKYNEELQNANGTITEKTDWVQPTKNKLLELFPKISESISPEQYQYCNKTWGYDCVRSPQELNLIFRYANEIRKKNIMNSKKLKRIANKKIYKPIYGLIIQAIEYRDENYMGC